MAANPAPSTWRNTSRRKRCGSRRIDDGYRRVMNDRIRELDVFLRVTEETSFSAAARSLDCNPSTVSKLIQRMEDRLGVRLFHRTSRVLKLTHEGERFLEGAHRVIDALEE